MHVDGPGAGSSTTNSSFLAAASGDDSTMGVPDLSEIMRNRLSNEQATNLNNYIQVIESSDTDISQQSWHRMRLASKPISRRLLAKVISFYFGAGTVSYKYISPEIICYHMFLFF